MKISVGRRLLLLVACEALVVVAIALGGFFDFSRISNDAEHMYQYQVLSLEDIGENLEKASQLESLTRPHKLQALQQIEVENIDQLITDIENFLARYSKSWEKACGMAGNHTAFVQDLKDTGHFDIVDRENRLLSEVRKSLDTVKHDHGDQGSAEALQRRWLEADHLRLNLASLLNITVECATISHAQLQSRATNAKYQLAGIGLVGLILSLFLGLMVHRAIAPRITRLVGKVQKFKDFGINEKIIEEGRDEIAILSNALDSGFAAISERDKEREDFLASVAHELKTPTTSIQGFSTMLLNSPQSDAKAQARALDIIRRQSWRLSRLIEDLFLVTRAQNGRLGFRPAPCDVSAVVEKAVKEVKPFLGSQNFSLRIEPDIRTFADDTLLEHAISNMITCASSMAPSETMIDVAASCVDNRARISVKINCANIPHNEVESLFSPFQKIHYENKAGARANTGLYLSREIARLHNGTVSANEIGGAVEGLMFVLEIPG